MSPVNAKMIYHVIGCNVPDNNRNPREGPGLPLEFNIQGQVCHVREFKTRQTG